MILEHNTSQDNAVTVNSESGQKITNKNTKIIMI